MYRMTTSFLQGEVAALSHGRRKASSPWKPSEVGDKPTFKKGFKINQKPDRMQLVLILTKTPKKFLLWKKESSKLTPNGKIRWKKGIPQASTANFSFRSTGIKHDMNASNGQCRKHWKKGKRPERNKPLNIYDASNPGDKSGKPWISELISETAMSFRL
ncbi:hypothetical protein Tco_0490273 [Tanacetum coccineum]